jgi:hypothetical protein
MKIPIQSKRGKCSRQLPRGGPLSGSGNGSSGKVSRGHLRSQSLRAARKENREDIERIKSEKIKAWKESRKHQPRYKETQGHFRPDKWGYGQRGEYDKKYIDEEPNKASTTELGSASPIITQDQWARPELPLAIMRLLRKDE